MVIVDVINKNIFESGEKVIAQQCNCVCRRGHGLSLSIAKKYPYADIYRDRVPMVGNSRRNCTSDPLEPGTIKISEPYDTNSKDPTVIAMFAQWAPGKARAYEKQYPMSGNAIDNEKYRLHWFEFALDEILEAGYDQVAMPYFIGCGLAGGEWKSYKQLLEDSELKIVLYKI